MPKNVRCKNCGNLVNDWCKKVADSPDPDLERDCQHYREKTNADRIRAITDEELAQWLIFEYGRCEWCDENKDCTDADCLACVVGWLRQPAKED
jgi:predicted RNA-binding protein with PIN domain